MPLIAVRAAPRPVTYKAWSPTLRVAPGLKKAQSFAVKGVAFVVWITPGTTAYTMGIWLSSFQFTIGACAPMHYIVPSAHVGAGGTRPMGREVTRATAVRAPVPEF